MKNTYIILISVVLSCFLNSCIEYEEQNDPRIKDFNDHYYEWVILFSVEKEKIALLQKTAVLRKQTEDLWKIYRDSACNIVLKKKIVYIKRMASSSVMNAPAFYEKNYSGSTVTEHGKGAENEDFTVFYLSDGTIIKASPKVNPEWLGTTVGEKVLKTTGKKLTSTIQKMRYIEVDARYSTYWGWRGIGELTTATKFEYGDYTDYQPLYQK